MQKIYLGDEPAARVYHQGQLTYPNPVKDGLVLWYDFMGRQNSDAKRAVAEDLSGNGNDGALVNFAFEGESGYERGLRFDGVDDKAHVKHSPSIDFGSINFSIEFLIKPDPMISATTPFAVIKGTRTYVSDGHGWDVGHGSTLSGVSFSLNDKKNFNRYTILFDEGITWENLMDEFTHIVLIVDRVSGSAFFYKNGIRQKDEMDISMVTGSITSTNELILSSTYGWKNIGNTRLLRLYKKSLSVEEIVHNYQMEKERWNL